MRRHMRYHVRVPVTVQAADGGSLVGLSTDFSESGMALYVSERFQIGQFLRLEFPVPTLRQTITVNASVRHSEGFRYGVEFRELDSTKATLLSTSCTCLSALLLPAESSNSVAVQA